MFTRKHFTVQKMKFSIKDFFSKCDQIRRKLLLGIKNYKHVIKKKKKY